jgi:hypothetical protein
MQLGCSLPVADIGRREITVWKNAGVTHVTAHTAYASAPWQVAGHSVADHLTAITRYREAVADLAAAPDLILPRWRGGLEGRRINPGGVWTARSPSASVRLYWRRHR